MATALNHYRLAWVLNIKSATQIYAATTDLPEAAAVTNLGAFYTKRIVNIDAQLTVALPNLFYGMPQSQAVEFTLDNSDLALSSSYEWRLVPVILYHYNRDTDTKTTDFSGVITRARFAGTRVTLTIGTYNGAVMDELLPAAVIDPAVGSPFETAGAAGAAVPVIFGANVPVRPPACANSTSDPGGDDFLVSHGNVYVRSVYQDSDPELPGLEKLGAWVTAPGSPAYVSTTVFSCTGDQRVRYDASGGPIRFKTTASPTNFIYSNITAYDTATNRATIQDALLDSGITSVQISGDYLVIRGYQNVTDGLLPEPGAPGADLTAVRLPDGGDSPLIVFADNPTYSITAHIADIVKAILINADWGLSTRSVQAVNAASFAAANIALAVSPSLIGAVQGALGYDGEQRQARNVLDELLMMRGMRLYQNDSSEWLISVDGLPAAVSKSFQLDTGLLYGIPIKRILDHGKVDAEQSTRNLILHWSPLGRGKSGEAKFTTKEYARSSTKAVSSVGRDLHIYNQWIRDQTIAEQVCHYLAEKMQGADDRLSFVAGQEARDIALGESITVTAPSDGITGDWQVYGISKTLADVTLNCIRANPDAYGAVAGVTSSAVPDERETRTATGGGSNVLPNPDFGGPYVEIASTIHPTGWVLGPSSGTATYEIDYSAANLPSLVSGHYLRYVVGTALTPVASSNYHALMLLKVPCPPELSICSLYCDQSDGVFMWVDYWTTAGAFIGAKLVQTTYDSTDINGLGWGRHYGRFHPPSTTGRIRLAFGFSKVATFQVEAAQVEAVERTARRPTKWRRHKPQPLTEFAASELTFSGASTYTATSLIPAGVKVVGVTGRVTQAIVYGTATSYSIGTTTDPLAWASSVNLTALDAVTSSYNFTTTTEAYYPTATSVLITGNGTITSGKMRLVVEYTRPAPVSGV